MQLSELKATVIAFGNLQVPENQRTQRWCGELLQTAVQMAEANQLAPQHLAEFASEIGRVERCLLLKLVGQANWKEEIEEDLKRWANA